MKQDDQDPDQTGAGLVRCAHGKEQDQDPDLYHGQRREVPTAVRHKEQGSESDQEAIAIQIDLRHDRH